APDLVALLQHDLANPAVGCRFEGAARGPAVPLRRGEGSERGPAAVGEDDPEAEDVVERLAIDDGAGAGGVVADHAAEVGPAGGGGVGAELQAVAGRGAVELVEDDAGLDAGRPGNGVEVENGVEVLAAIENDAGPDRLAGEAGAAAAGRDRHAHL